MKKSFEKICTLLAERCRQEIEDYDERVSIAIGLMDRMRCPLSHVEPVLCSEIEDIISEYGEEYEVDVDDITAEDIIYK